MRAFTRLLGLVVFTLTASCNNTAGSLSCTTDTDCRTAGRLGGLFPDGSAPELFPVCCDSVCALPAGGCDSGFRYLTDGPGYGDCITDPMCVLPAGDMSMPATTD
jgi:hypothetical protein